MSETVAYPLLSAILTGIMRQFQATAATPILLFVEAAAVPATIVPWPLTSLVSALLSYIFQPGTRLAARSGWVPSIPVSRMAMITFALPVFMDQASGPLIF